MWWARKIAWFRAYVLIPKFYYAHSQCTGTAKIFLWDVSAWKVKTNFGRLTDPKVELLL